MFCSCSRLVERVESIGDETKRNRSVTSGYERSELEKLRALQQHSAKQQQLIGQLQSKLNEYELREAALLQKVRSFKKKILPYSSVSEILPLCVPGEFLSSFIQSVSCSVLVTCGRIVFS